MTEPRRAPFLTEHIHYVSHGSPDGTYRSVCRAAIVTALSYLDPEMTRLDKLTADICVLNPTGMFFREAAERDSSGADAPGSWHLGVECDDPAHPGGR